MKTEFVRDFKKNYLVICDEQVLCDNYEYKMMMKNEVPGLLPCSERMINGVGYLYYDITSKHSLAQFYENSIIGMDTIRTLFLKISDICEQMEKYLLLEDGLCFEPENIFLDANTEDYSLVYYKSDTVTGSGLEPLVMFLLERIDGNDIKATEAIYKMADMTSTSCYGVDEILSWFIEEYCSDNEDLSVVYPCTPTYDTERVVEENDYDDAMKVSKQKVQKKAGFIAFIRTLFGKKDEDEDTVELLDDYCYEDNSFDTLQDLPDNRTVFIPWLENSENKLYGVGKGNKLHIELNKAPITVGKLRGHVDVVIEDDSISRLHAKIVREGNKFLLSDLNSTNGTYRNGLRLNPNETLPIEPGDEIAFGKLKFIYR